MKQSILVFIFFASTTFAAVPADNQVCFSPEQKCDEKLWEFIQSATKSLDIAIFDLTHEKIQHEIAVAHAVRKIPVRVVVDTRQAKGKHSLVSTLIKAGVPVKFGTQRGIMHNKFTIVDGKRLETGSFNYTDGAATKNNENQIYLGEPTVVKTYAERFEKLWAEGRPASFDKKSVSRKTDSRGEVRSRRRPRTSGIGEGLLQSFVRHA